jgi:hypothetical protein
MHRDFLSFPKTSDQIPSSRFPIVDGKTGIQPGGTDFTLDDK